MKFTKNINILIGAISILFLSVPLVSKAQLPVDPGFNPSRIIEDADLLDYDSMSLGDIQNFLEKHNSYLANYKTTDTYGVMNSAATIIYNASHNNYDCDGVNLSDKPTETEKIVKCKHITTVNPKFLLVLLQKEASLIDDSNPSQRRLDRATGYACPDNWVCNPYYKGFGKQVNSAALQFLSYMKEPNRYNYRAGGQYVFNNTLNPYCTAATKRMSIRPQNKATAALYNYTPHVFNGNYNVYRLWKKYFPNISRTYPDGSIIKANGDPRIWLIEGGKKRHFANWSSFISRFRPQQIVKVNSDELNNYPEGPEIKFANYSIVQTPDKKLYLLVDGTKRPFKNQSVFKKIGFNPAEIDQASASDLKDYKLGKTITTQSSYITGALLKDSKTKKIYYVTDDSKALVDKEILNIKFPGQKIIEKSHKELAKYATTSPVLLDDGSLVRTKNYPLIYLISNHKKRPFIKQEVFNKLNYNPDNVITLSSQFLYNYDMGAPIQ